MHTKCLQWLGWMQGALLQVLQQSHQLRDKRHRRSPRRTSHQDFHAGYLPGAPGAWNMRLGPCLPPLGCTWPQKHHQPGPCQGKWLQNHFHPNPATSHQWQILNRSGEWRIPVIPVPLSTRQPQSGSRACTQRWHQICWKTIFAMTSRHHSHGILAYTR